MRKEDFWSEVEIMPEHASGLTDEEIMLVLTVVAEILQGEGAPEIVKGCFGINGYSVRISGARIVMATLSQGEAEHSYAWQSGRAGGGGAYSSKNQAEKTLYVVQEHAERALIHYERQREGSMIICSRDTRNVLYRGVTVFTTFGRFDLACAMEVGDLCNGIKSLMTEREQKEIHQATEWHLKALVAAAEALHQMRSQDIVLRQSMMWLRKAATNGEKRVMNAVRRMFVGEALPGLQGWKQMRRALEVEKERERYYFWDPVLDD